MAKDSYYFSHDYNTRTDPKIKGLLVKHGVLGYGVFWAIVEDLYNNTNVLPIDYDSIAYELHTDTDTVKSIINNFGLFVVSENTFSSNSIQRRLDDRNSKSIKAKESIKARWDKEKRITNVPENDTNVLRLGYEPNTNKGKESKRNKIVKIDIPLPEKVWADSGINFSDKIKDSWLSLCNNSKWKKKNENALHLCIKQISKYPEQFALTLIEKSISGDYQGIVFDNTDEVFEKWKLKNNTLSASQNDDNAINPHNGLTNKQNRELFPDNYINP